MAHWIMHNTVSSRRILLEEGVLHFRSELSGDRPFESHPMLTMSNLIFPYQGSG